MVDILLIMKIRVVRIKIFIDDVVEDYFKLLVDICKL